MILSHEQQVLVAQLIKKQEQPVDCVQLINANAKTRAFGRLFEENGLLTLSDESVEFNPEFFEQATLHGILDEMGEVTETGDELSQQQIEETYKLLKAMLRAAS